jgi:hypothetical protein
MNFWIWSISVEGAAEGNDTERGLVHGRASPHPATAKTVKRYLVNYCYHSLMLR